MPADSPVSPTAATEPTRARIGLNLAAGGPLGGIYELGALCALDEALDGINIAALDVYVGVSAGGFLAAGLANGLGPQEMYDIFISNRSTHHKFEPEMFLRPAYSEYFRRAKTVPHLVLQAFKNFIYHPKEIGLLGAVAKLGEAIPTGLFDNEAIDEFLTDIFSRPGRTNDFRALGRKLFIVATDLDTGRAVKFGGRGHDHVPISKAVQASAALPGLFPPVEIDGDHFVDGALKRTLHASISLDEQADLVLCVNPIVPYDAKMVPADRDPKYDRLWQGGLPVVLSQTFRAIIHSRMTVGMASYSHSHKHADVLLFEPSHGDTEMFFSNLFSYSDREQMCEHAYQRTRQDLYNRREELTPILARHGITLNVEALADPDRRLNFTGGELDRHTTPADPMNKLRNALDVLDDWLLQSRQKAKATADA